MRRRSSPAPGEVVSKGGEVDVGQSGGRRGWEEVAKEGFIDAVRGVFARKGGEAGCLASAGELLGFPYRRRGEGRKVTGPMGELGLLYGGEVGSAG